MNNKCKRRTKRIHHNDARSLRLTIAGAVLVLARSADAQQSAQAVDFNAALLRSPVDTRVFGLGNPVPPGEHRSDVYMNGIWRGRAMLEFRLPSADAHSAVLCFDNKLIALLGLTPSPNEIADTPTQCEPLSALIPGADANYDSAAHRLDATAPQALLQRSPRGSVDPQQWDHGVDAATLQYNYNSFHTSGGQFPSITSHFVALRSGVNLGDWRFRMNGGASWMPAHGWSFTASQVYAERSLIDWRSKLTMGDSVTDGRVFDSLGFRGVQLSSDERMDSNSRRGFAPVIRGVANSNAKVSVWQRDVQIYQTTVPPGPFVIDDLDPTGSGGDLQVSITEADGSERRFTVSFAATTELLRPGVTRYGLTAGRYRSHAMVNEPWLAQATLRHGFSNLLTGYGGLLLAQDYVATSGGVALNSDFGALGLDVTHARSSFGNLQFNNANRSGVSTRATWSKLIATTDTNLTLAVYRYSGQGYLDAATAFMLRDQALRGNSSALSSLVPGKHRLQINAAQNLPGQWGSLSLSAALQDYWRRDNNQRGGGSRMEYQLNYSKPLRRVTLNLNAGRAKRLDTMQWESRIMLSLALPLGDGNNSPTLNSSFLQESGGKSISNSLSGTWDTGNGNNTGPVGYNLYANTAFARREASNTTWGAGASWQAPVATLSANYSQGNGFRQYGTGASGALVVYQGGLVLAPNLGDTAAIVEADNASGARVTNYSSLRLDKQGRAVVPYLSPFQRNAVEIDPRGISTDVELKTSIQQIAPIAGSVSLVRFETETGYSALLQGRLADGTPLPFGASIQDQSDHVVGHVGQAGKALVRVRELQGVLTVQVDADGVGQCRLPYALPSDHGGNPSALRRMEAQCESAGTNQDTAQ